MLVDTKKDTTRRSFSWYPNFHFNPKKDFIHVVDIDRRRPEMVFPSHINVTRLNYMPDTQ